MKVSIAVSAVAEATYSSVGSARKRRERWRLCASAWTMTAQRDPLSPEGDVWPGIAGPDGRQMVREAPLGGEISLGWWRLATDAPPVVQKPERER